MVNWRTNLIVLWFGQFLVMSGMTMIIPFLPLYIQELGIREPDRVAVWSGIIFAGNFVTSFLFQPIWGRLADRRGRKIMLLRSGFGMAVVMTLMGFSTSPWQLLLLRIVNGTISGFVPAAVALVSTNTPKDKIGFAMGTLQSGGVAGTILGPLFGGLMAGWFGFRPIFYITGSLLFAAAFLTLFVVKERFDAAQAAKKAPVSVLRGFRQLSQTPQLPALFAATFFIQFSLLSSMPLIPLFVQQLHGNTPTLAFYAGLVGSVTGLSNMVASPLLGRLGDKLGAERILVIALFGAGLASVPQAFVQNIWQLLGARFILGVFIGGLLPSVNSLIRKYAPEGRESAAYGFNSSFLSLGNLTGPVVGGFLSGWIHIQGVFILAALMLFSGSYWARRTLYGKARRTADG